MTILRCCCSYYCSRSRRPPPLHGRSAIVDGLRMIVAGVTDFGGEGANVGDEGGNVFSYHVA